MVREQHGEGPKEGHDSRLPHAGCGCSVLQEEAAKKQEAASEQAVVIAREKEQADSALMEALPAVEAAAQV